MSWPAKLVILLAVLVAGFMGGIKYHAGVVAARDLAQRQSEEKVRARQLDRANTSATSFEADKVKNETRTRTITVEVEKIVERPVYLNACFEPDGLRALNRAIQRADDPGQPSLKLPRPAAGG